MQQHNNNNIHINIDVENAISETKTKGAEYFDWQGSLNALPVI